MHKGHQHLIETALDEMDHLIVVIYNAPETTPIPLQVRAGWIRTLYPQVEVIEAWDGPTQIGDTPAIKQLHEAYLLRILGNRAITAFYSSEFYGDHGSKALKAQDRRLDRTVIDVSGTEIRSDPFKYRSFLDPFVYQDFITNVVFVGAPCTGKTTLAKKMAKIHQTQWMPEYGRSYWESHQVNKRLTREQLVEIAATHLEQETRLMHASNQYLFTDTNAVTTYMFGQYYHGGVLKALADLAQYSEKWYDVWFLCGDDIPYEDTWDRSGEPNRAWFQFQIESDLKVRKIPYITLRGDLNQRIQKVNSILARYRKFESILNQFLEE